MMLLHFHALMYVNLLILTPVDYQPCFTMLQHATLPCPAQMLISLNVPSGEPLYVSTNWDNTDTEVAHLLLGKLNAAGYQVWRHNTHVYAVFACLHSMSEIGKDRG